MVLGDSNMLKVTVTEEGESMEAGQEPEKMEILKNYLSCISIFYIWIGDVLTVQNKL